MKRSSGAKTKGKGGAGSRMSLRNLAELAGVDVSTVSRALNGDPRISADRAAEIKKLAEKVGYRPRPLRTKRAAAVGLLIATATPGVPDDPYLERVAWQTEGILSARGLHTHLECVTRADGRKHPIPTIVRENRVDGVLVAGHPPVRLIEGITELGVPVVALNDSAARLRVSCVRADPVAAVNAMVLRLAAWGHQRFVHLTSDLQYPTVRARRDSFVASLDELGIKHEPGWVATGLKSNLAGGRAGVREVMKRRQKPTAIICVNDWMAMGAMHELQRRGLEVPGDVSVAGHDDLPFCSDLEPALTSVARSEEQIVSRAVDLLLAQADGAAGEPEEVMIEEEVAWRDSTGVAPGRR